MLSDIEIAQRAEMYPIGKVAAELSIEEEDIEYYGHYKAKLSEQLFKKLDSKPCSFFGTESLRIPSSYFALISSCFSSSPT